MNEKILDTYVKVHLTHQKIDFTKYVNETIPLPTKNFYQPIAWEAFKLDSLQFKEVFLQRNDIELYDHWYDSFGFPTFEGNFYRVH